MIKNFRELTDEENSNMILDGTSFAHYVAFKDKELYEKSKNSELEDISDYQKMEINILGILEKLGFSMDELGTYLYKDLIMNCYNEVKDISTIEDISRCRKLMAELNDAFSSFYSYLANDDKELGLKSFHLYIERAISAINEEAIDKNLSLKIFGRNPEETTYGIMAFQLACYVAKFYELGNEIKNPKIRKLSNMPDEIRFKNEAN